MQAFLENWIINSSSTKMRSILFIDYISKGFFVKSCCLNLLILNSCTLYTIITKILNLKLIYIVLDIAKGVNFTTNGRN